MSAEKQPTKNRGLLIALVTGVFALVAVGAAALLVNISERKTEAKHAYVKVVEVTENDTDPAKWGKNWPREFDDYKRTAERTSTKYGGGAGTSEGELPPQKADRDPWLKRVFAGYLFAVDYRDRRGHAFMLHDQEVTKRNVPADGKQSGNCLHCHGSIVPLYKKLGKEAAPQASEADQLQAGLAKVAEMGYWDAHKALEDLGGGKAHPVSCVDCHDPSSMEVRVTRPGFIAGIQKLAASTADVTAMPSIERWRKGDKKKPYDPNLDSTRQEKRAFVCGQCHVEYFCGKGMTLLFPWAEGLKVEQAEHLYDNMQVKGQRFKDWTHAETGFELLKAQHPEFELWSQGIHARAGVTCACQAARSAALVSAAIAFCCSSGESLAKSGRFETASFACASAWARWASSKGFRRATMASIIRTAACPARPSRAKWRSWMVSTRARSSSSPLGWQVAQARLTLVSGLRTQWSETLRAPSRW